MYLLVDRSVSFIEANLAINCFLVYIIIGLSNGALEPR